MVSDTSRPARARSAEEKNQRRDDILGAAERLWTTTPYADLSMNQVAREAQLAKGTLYLYFDTKEELFLALLSNHLRGWIDRIIAVLQERRPRTSTQLADAMLDSGYDLAPMRRLLVLLGTVLERNVRPELKAEFQQDMKLRLQGMLELMPFKPEISTRVLRHMYALAIGWQQLSEEADSDDETNDLRVSWNRSFNTEFELATRAVIDQLAKLNEA